MTAITRKSDIGVGHCSDHDTTIVTKFQTGANSVQINNKTCCVIRTIGSASCGHNSRATTGSPNVFAENKPVHRIKDSGIVDGGRYTVKTGSPNVFANDGGNGGNGNAPNSATLNSEVISDSSADEEVVEVTPQQQARFKVNVRDVNEYNTPYNINYNIDKHPELEPDPAATEVPTSVKSKPDNLVNSLDQIKQEADQGKWKETGNNPNITKLYGNVGFPQYGKNDRTAWCAGFVGSTLKENGYEYQKTLAAGDYTKYGNPVSLNDVQKGDIMVFNRERGTGHVAFYYGPGPTPGTVRVLGGNQSDNVTVQTMRISDLKSNGIQRPKRSS